MTDYDNQLQELVLQAQQYPAKSAQRRIALMEFIQALRQSGRLTRPRSGSYPHGLYEDIYDEAVQRLFVHICDRIETYNPQKGNVLQWVNFLLSRRFFNEASRDILPTLPKGVDARGVTCLSIDELERHEAPDAYPHSSTVGEELRGYIENDPEKLLQTMHVEMHPEATFQVLLLRRLEKCSWKVLSTELGIPLPTLHSFYRRSLQKMVPVFKEYLS